MQVTENILYGAEASDQALDVYLPEGEARDVFVYFHGGGLERGDKKSTARVIAPYLTVRGVAWISAV